MKVFERKRCAPALLVLAYLPCWAGTWNPFGPKTYVRSTSAPVTVTDTFSIRNPNTQYTLHLQNGGLQDDVSEFVSSTVITVNGVTVVAPGDFNQTTATLDRAVQLQVGTNTIAVQVRGKPGGQLAATIIGVDNDVPTIQATVFPAPNAASWNNTAVTVSFKCDDATSGVASCASPVTVTSEGAGQVVTGKAVDLAGNVATTSVTVNIDLTRPTITPNLVPPANNFGWNNTNVTVNFVCADALSGVASCSLPASFTTEGAGQTASGTATDKAGNSASTTATVNIDKTPPTISATVTPAPDAHGIVTLPSGGSATVSFTCADSLSGVATCPSTIQVSTPGANQQFSGTAADKAGNAASVSVTFSVEAAPLTITASASPAANANGWNNTPVTVSHQCAGGVPPVKCPASQTVSTEGANQTSSATATDAAGQNASATATLNIDLTPPLISATVSPAANAQGVATAPATVTFTCSDALSGVASCPSPVQVSTAGLNQSFNGTATDKAGNTASANITFSVQTAPLSILATAAPPANLNGWNNTAVTVSYQCSGGVPPVQCPASQTVSAEGANQSISATATDAAGQTTSATSTLNIDLTPPVISATVSPAANAQGVVTAPATVTFTCSDALSGVATCPAAIQVTTTGLNQSFSGTATDNAGNTANANVTFSVQTAPLTILATAAPGANANGWNNTAVTVSYQCSGGVPPVQCPAPQTVSAEGANQAISATASDAAGQTASVSTSLNIDLTPPVITATVLPSPNAAGIINATSATVTFTCSDALSGVATCPSPVTTTTTGLQTISGRAIDKAGNTASASIQFTLQPFPPLKIAATVSPVPNAAGWNNTPVTVTFQCSGGAPPVFCPGPQTVKADGANQVVTGTAIDALGNSAVTSASVNLDQTPPLVSITSPPDGSVSPSANIVVSGLSSDALSGLASVSCNGAAATVSGANFSCGLLITQGSLAVSVTATDVAGNSASASIAANLQGPKVAITSPAPLDLFNTKSITVTGTVDDLAATIAVNGVSTPNNAGVFTAQGVVLREGNNVVTATATNAGGAVGSANVSVILDTTPPIVVIDSPSDGAIVTSSQVYVTGMVNDVVPGSVNSAQVSVTVNGVKAGVFNRSFMAEDVLLVPGKNIITAVATDRAGNTNQSQTSVTLVDAAAQQRILMVSGNAQTGPAGTALPQPLVVQVVNSVGQPLPNVPITFAMNKSDGQLAAFPQQGRQIVVPTDANGQASATLQLGTRAGNGTNQVLVTSPGFVGEVMFCETSTVGAPTQIHDIAGETQKGIISQPLPEPFAVVVFDAGGNPVAGVSVIFTVEQGGGTLEGNSTVTKTTDSDGRATAVLVLAQQEGINNNVVSASFAGLTGTPVSFVASGVTPSNPANTTVSGIVLDNGNSPIVNVTASIQGTNLKALTDSTGRFTIANAPVGSIDLFIDGSTSTEAEPYPFLEFPMVTVAGQDNHLAGPIFLPELDVDNSAVVGGDQDVTLTMKGVPGVLFTVLARSATFPDGTKVGKLSVSQVHTDKVPMPPPNATAPRLFWTVQPPRVKFNPPMRIQIPNTEGLPAGTVTEIFCYNHDLEEFASGGTARVSEDGSVIVSDPGSGVIVSGWGDAPPPPPPPNTCASKCNCGVCIKGICVPAIGSSNGNACDDNDACTVNDRCNLFAQCKGEKIAINSLTITVDGKTDPLFGTLVKVINRAINFSVNVDSSHCTGITYDWDFGDGSHSTDQSPVHTYTVPGDYHPSVNVKCQTCADKQTAVELFVVNVTIAKPTGDPATAGSDDNQFTYTGTLFGSTVVLVQAKVDPDTAEPSVRGMIQWSFSGVPNGSTLAWFSTCPSNSQNGCGTFDLANLSGYPNTNDQFGRRTITMNVVDDSGNTLITASSDIELFFDRDASALLHGVPNWFFYWNQTPAGNANATFANTANAFGTTPALLNWSTYAGPRSTVTIDRAVLGSDTRRDGSGQLVSGIDLFANTVRHELRHVKQVFDSNTVNFFTGLTGVLRNAAAAGWSFNVACHQGLWNHFTDNDHSGSFTQGDTDLDQNCDDLPDTMEPSAADLATCVVPGGQPSPIECQAGLAETVPEDTFKNIDWANPGKQHH